MQTYLVKIWHLSEVIFIQHEQSEENFSVGSL
jgi:hypothetical protein